MNTTVDSGRCTNAQLVLNVTQIDCRAIERGVRRSLAEWQTKLTGRAIDETRQTLREILVGPVTLTPEAEPIALKENSRSAVCCVGATTYNLWYAPGRTRTCGPELRRLVLYPPELRAHSSILAERASRCDGGTRFSVNTRSQNTGDGMRFPDSH